MKEQKAKIIKEHDFNGKLLPGSIIICPHDLTCLAAIGVAQILRDDEGPKERTVEVREPVVTHREPRVRPMR